MKANSTGRVFPATDGLRRATGLRTRTASLERAVAYFIVVASQIPIGSSQFLRLSLVVIVPLLPVFLTEWVRGAKEKRILLLVFLCIVSGLLLALKNVDQSRSWDSWSALSESVLPLVLVVAAAGLNWSCKVLGMKQFLILWAASAAVFAPLMGGRFLENPWKFGLALPISLLVIVLVGQRSSRMVTLAIVALMAVSASLSFRSWLLVLGLALLIHLFRTTANTGSRTKVRWQKISLVVTLGFATIIGGNVMSDLALQGYLGTYAQTRTQQSIDVSGNPFLGSRAEWGGAIALATSEPLGIGAGVTPSSSDWSITIHSLTLSEGLKDRSNVADSFRVGRIEFHSTLWNYWSYFGLAGILLATTALGHLARASLALNTQIFRQMGLPVGAMAVLLTGAIWDILFSPVNSWTLAVALLVSLQVMRHDLAADGIDPHKRDSSA